MRYLTIAAAVLAATGSVASAEPLKLSSSQMDEVTAGRGHAGYRGQSFQRRGAHGPQNASRSNSPTIITYINGDNNTVVIIIENYYGSLPL